MVISDEELWSAHAALGTAWSREEMWTLLSGWLPLTLVFIGLNVFPFCIILKRCVPLTPVFETSVKVLESWFILSHVSGCFQFCYFFSGFEIILVPSWSCAWDPCGFYFQCSPFPLNSVLKMPHPLGLESQLHNSTHTLQRTSSLDENSRCSLAVCHVSHTSLRRCNFFKKERKEKTYIHLYVYILNGKGSACQYRRHGFHPWVEKIPWRRKWQPTPAFLPGESHGPRSLAGYSPWGHKRVRCCLVTKQEQNIYIYVCICMYACVYICMYVNVFIYIHTGSLQLAASGFSSQPADHVADLPHVGGEAPNSVWFHFASQEAETQSETSEKTSVFLMVFTQTINPSLVGRGESPSIWSGFSSVFQEVSVGSVTVFWRSLAPGVYWRCRFLCLT